MRLLRFLHCDRFNMIDVLTAVVVIAFVPSVRQAVAWLGGSFLVNVFVGGFIRWSDR
jgi:hypothetical protein